MPDDVASLGFAVNSSELLAGSAALDKLNASAQRLAPSQALVANASQRLSREQQLAASSSRAVTRAQAELGDKIDLLSRNTDQAYRSLSTRSFFRLLAREASLAGGPLAGMIQHFGILGVGGQRLGVGLTASTIAFAGMVAVAYKAVEAFTALEGHQANVSAALQATRAASGQTVASLERLTQSLGASGTQTLGNIRAAELELIKLKAVSGDTFGDVLRLAKDVAATGFVDLKGAVTALGKAMKDPADANDHLADTGLKLSVAQQTLARQLQITGDRAGAQRLILKALSEQMAGADAKAADTVSSAFQRFMNSGSATLEQWGKLIAEGTRLKEVLNGIAAAMELESKDSSLLAAALGVLGLGYITAAANKMTGGNKGAAATTTEPLRLTVNPSQSNVDAAELERKQKLLDGVIASLKKAGETAGKSAIEQEVYNRAVEAEAVGNTAAERAIRGVVNANMAKNATRETVDAIKLQTAQTKIETDTLTMTTGAAAAYRVEQEALARERIKGVDLSAAQVAAIHREAQAYGQATEAAQKFRQLKEFARDAGDLNKQLDILAVGGINTIASGLTDIAMGTKSVKEGFRDMSLAVIRMLEEMIIKMLIARALQAALGGFGGGTYGGGGVGDQGPTLAMMRHTGGMVDFSGTSRYVHPAHFDNAPRFARGGIVGGEVPIIAHRGEGVFTPAQMAAMGGGGHSVVNININLDGANGDEAIHRIANAAARQGTQQAIAIVNAGAPARQQRFNMLGT